MEISQLSSTIKLGKTFTEPLEAAILDRKRSTALMDL